MYVLSDYSQAVDHAAERDEAITRAYEAAADSAYIDLKRNAARKAERAELWQSLLDSGTGPAKNEAHGRLIEAIAAIDPELFVADDAASVQYRRRLLDSIACVAFEDVLFAEAAKAVRS